MKILVTYASIGGNTMMVGQKIFELLQLLGFTEVELIDMEKLEPKQLAQYPVVFIGSSCWNDGGYNDYSEVFFDNLKKTELDLSKGRFAVYALGEKFYPVFCGVVDLMKEELAKKGAKFIGEPLTIDGFPDDKVMDDVESWVNAITPLL